MNMLSPIAALLGIEVEAITERVRNAIIVNTIIGLFAALGAGFLLAAVFMALAAEVGAFYGALIFAGGFLVLALAVFIGAQIGQSRRERTEKARRRSSETSAFVTTAALTALPVLLKSPLTRTVGLPAAAIAAYLLVKGGSDKTDE